MINKPKTTYIETIEDGSIDKKLDDLSNRLLVTNSITFNSLIYLKEILKSYKNIDDIYYQFNLDCNRTNIEVNNNRINDIGDFRTHLGWLQNVSFTNDKLNNIYDYLVMLTLQSSYYFPYATLHKLHST